MAASLLAVSALYFARVSSINPNLKTKVPKIFLGLRAMTLSNSVLLEIFTI